MGTKDGQTAALPYRVRVAGVWYWVDPTVSAGSIEPGDTVVLYPADGDASLAILRSRLTPGDAEPKAMPIVFSTLEGERFEVLSPEIAALHLAAVDDEQ